jgi:adenine-specific DNA-methyltransferase
MNAPRRQKVKHKFGQYFTPEGVAQFMVSLADVGAQTRILEPACGDGVFLRQLQAGPHDALVGFEIDPALATDLEGIRYTSFISAEIAERFDLVIGNPPYIRWANLEPHLKAELQANALWNTYFNRLCDYSGIFILKAISLLADGGHLIFICPEYWLNTTHALPLRNYMVAHGHFEEIYHFNETPIFENASVSLIIFKYVKSKKRRAPRIKVAKYESRQKLTFETLLSLQLEVEMPAATYLSIQPFRANERWLLESDAVQTQLESLESACRRAQMHLPSQKPYVTIGEVCDIGNGLVSGLDQAFQVEVEGLNELERIRLCKVIKAKHLQPYIATAHTDYIFLPDCPAEDNLAAGYPNFYAHFQKFRSSLENRYQYQRKIPYWEWVFPRNLALFSRDEQRILVPCKERISNKDHFRFALADAGFFPTQDVTALLKKPAVRESIAYIAAFLNHPRIFHWLKCNGIVKGSIVEFSEKPLGSIPFRKIDWENAREVELHDTITKRVQALTAEPAQAWKQQVNALLDALLENR